MNTRHILHNAADILCTNIILFFTILPNHTEGKPQSRDQKQVGNQQDNSGRHINGHHKNNQHERKCKTLCHITDLMGQDFFIVVYIACDGIDIIAGLSLGKPGKRDTLQMVAHKEAGILADLCTADLRFGIAIAVNQDTKKKNHRDHTGQNQDTVHVKLSRPQKLHDRVKQHKQAAGEKPFQNSPANANIKITVLFQYIMLTHAARLPPTDK